MGTSGDEKVEESGSRPAATYFVDDCNCDRGTHWHYHDGSNTDFETIQQLHLVCRSFCKVASSLLALVLRVELSAKSLDRIDRITQNPHIAAGVWSIRICTAYRPKQLAEDGAAYRSLQVKALASLEGACDWYTEFMDEITPDEIEGDEEAIKEAMGIYWHMHDAWNEWPDVSGDPTRNEIETELEANAGGEGGGGDFEGQGSPPPR